MINIIAGIVTYNPDIGLLEQEIDSLVKIGVKIVIIDNDSVNKDVLVNLLSDVRYNEILLIENKTNNGTAGAHNQILQYAHDNGFQWAITFDQDSVIPSNLIEEYNKYIQDDVGIISPFINYLTNEGKSIRSIPENKWEEKEWTIASASMIRVNAWVDVGGFDDVMFIDLVDRDFGYRVRQCGYRIIQVNTISLDHHLGNLTIRKLFGKTFYVGNHSPIRKYYKARNYIYLRKKGLFGYGYAYGHIAQMIFETFAFEMNKIEKIKSIIRGVMNGTKLDCGVKCKTL